MIFTWGLGSHNLVPLEDSSYSDVSTVVQIQLLDNYTFVHPHNLWYLAVADLEGIREFRWNPPFRLNPNNGQGQD